MNEFIKHGSLSRYWHGTSLHDNSGPPFLIPQFLGWGSGRGKDPHLTDQWAGQRLKSDDSPRLSYRIDQLGNASVG